MGRGRGTVGARLVALVEAIENGGDERQARRAVCEEYRLARAEALLTLEGRLGLAPLVRGGRGGGGEGRGQGGGRTRGQIGVGAGAGLKLSLGLGLRPGPKA